jgi:GNAT superfamily N-acetyltransferase
VSAAKAIIIRPYVEHDFETIVTRWHDSNITSFPYVAEHQKHTLADATSYFRNHVLVDCHVWIAEQGSQLCGVIALDGLWIRQLAVFPDYQRRGVGTALLAKARSVSVTELRLFSFQRNEVARAFYAKHGFVPVAFGVSPAPEAEPDVELRWVA